MRLDILLASMTDCSCCCDTVGLVSTSLIGFRV